MGRDSKLSRLATWMGRKGFVDLLFFNIQRLITKLLSRSGIDPLDSFTLVVLWLYDNEFCISDCDSATAFMTSLLQ